MSRKALHRHILDKAREAALAAISCYNQPNFSYREESFCILMINAWELLLKAKIIKDHGEDIKSVYVKDEHAKRKDGKPYANTKYRKNRAGNHITIGFKTILDKHLPQLNVENALAKQLAVLYEFRNASTHLGRKAQKHCSLEVFTATLQSFKLMSDQWFEEKIANNLMLIPLAFDLPGNFMSDATNEEARRLLEFVEQQEKELTGDDREHSIRVNVVVKFERSKKRLPTDDDPEGKFRNKYPWNFRDDLIPELKKRYSNFQQNEAFREAIRKLKQKSEFCGVRYLDPKKEGSVKKDFYSPNILEALEEELELKKVSTAEDNPNQQAPAEYLSDTPVSTHSASVPDTEDTSR